MLSLPHALNVEIIDDLQDILGDGYDAMVQEQINQAKLYLSEIGAHASSGDAKEMSGKAHSLKGSTGQVGLQGIHHLAAELERSANADGVVLSANSKQICDTLQKEFPAAVKALQAYITQRAAKAKR